MSLLKTLAVVGAIGLLAFYFPAIMTKVFSEIFAGLGNLVHVVVP